MPTPPVTGPKPPEGVTQCGAGERIFFLKDGQYYADKFCKNKIEKTTVDMWIKQGEKHVADKEAAELAAALRTSR